MTNNEIFNKLLHLTGVGLDKELTLELFRLGGELDVTQSKIKGWRTSLDNPRSRPMPDRFLGAFFQGLFTYRDIKEKEGIAVFNILGLPEK